MTHLNAFRFWVCLLLCLPVIACQDEGKGTQDDAFMTDSIPTDSLGQVIVPELLGRWQLVEMRNGDMPMSTEEIGESVMELTAQGRMITQTPDLPEEETEFSYRNDSLYNEDLGTIQRIEELSDQRLVLYMEVDKTPIRWIYRRLGGE